jgi:hypothetical protein
MWNLYSIATNQDAIRRLFGVAIDSAGNLPSLASVFPEQEAPVVRNQSGGRELVKICGACRRRQNLADRRLPTSATPHLRICAAGSSRNTVACASQQLFRICAGNKTRDRQEGRGLVRNQRRASAVRARRPMDHVQRRSRPKVKTGARFALDVLLTTAPNAIVKPIHPKAMPVILTTPEERDVWMRALGRSKSASTVIAGQCHPHLRPPARQRRPRRGMKSAEVQPAIGSDGSPGEGASP